MTTAQLETIRPEALALSETERARLASDLVASLDGPADSDLAEAWDMEICKRFNEVVGAWTIVAVEECPFQRVANLAAKRL